MRPKTSARKPSVTHNQINPYFEVINPFERRCRQCLRTVKTRGNTTNLRQHLERNHSVLWSKLELECIKGKEANPESVTDLDPDDPPQAGASGTSKDQPSTASVHQIPTPVLSTCVTTTTTTATTIVASSFTITCVSSSLSRPLSSSVQRTTQPPIRQAFEKAESFKEGGTRESLITNAILYMISVDLLPLNTVEHEGFCYLMSIVAPLYKIPSRATITNLLDEKYDFHFKKIKQVV